VYRWDTTADDGVLEVGWLREPPGRPEARVFQALTVSAVRAVVSRNAADAGMEDRRRNDLVLAVNEIATNSVRHAGGWGTLRMWREGDVLVCEVADKGTDGWAPLAPRSPEPDQVQGYGLWLANKLCERVQVHPTPGGTVVRLHMRV
jgi:anti-sigma regulatory factor (Ser/Thr protein kinase)